MDIEESTSDTLKIFSNTDEKLRQLGTVLATPKSRLIYSLLIDKELHAREIAKIVENNPNPRLPIIKFHLDKMVEIGLVTVTIRLQKKRGKYLKYYHASPFILISPPAFLEKIKNNKKLQSFFKNSLLGVSIICGLVVQFSMEVSFLWKTILIQKLHRRLANIS